jgi:hypothetical protein
MKKEKNRRESPKNFWLLAVFSGLKGEVFKPGFCNRAASTVVDVSPGWWGFRELKSSNVKMLQGAETAFFYSSLCSVLRFDATDISFVTPELGLSR